MRNNVPPDGRSGKIPKMQTDQLVSPFFCPALDENSNLFLWFVVLFTKATSYYIKRSCVSFLNYCGTWSVSGCPEELRHVTIWKRRADMKRDSYSYSCLLAATWGIINYLIFMILGSQNCNSYWNLINCPALICMYRLEELLIPKNYAWRVWIYGHALHTYKQNKCKCTDRLNYKWYTLKYSVANKQLPTFFPITKCPVKFAALSALPLALTATTQLITAALKWLSSWREMCAVQKCCCSES